MQMTPRPKRTPRLGATLIVSLIAAGAVAAPATAQETEQTKVFKPVHKTQHKFFFAPSSGPADAVEGARILLRSKRSGASWARRVEVAKVQRAIERGSRLRLHKGTRIRGRLKVKVSTAEPDDGDTPEEPPPTPPPSEGIPSDWRRSASFESTLTSDVDDWRADSPFVVTRTNEAGGADGAYASKIVTNGGSSGCSCPRMKFEDGFSYGPGDEVWMSGSWRIPNPSKLAWSRLMNLGHFEASGDPDNWYLALLVRQPGEMEVVARHYQTDTGQSILMQPRPIPQNRWFDVAVRFVLSPENGKAQTEVYLDGELVASTTKQNMVSGTPLHFYNAGLSYFWPGNGNTTVYFDAPGLTS